MQKEFSSIEYCFTTTQIVNQDSQQNGKMLGQQNGNPHIVIYTSIYNPSTSTHRCFSQTMDLVTGEIVYVYPKKMEKSQTLKEMQEYYRIYSAKWADTATNWGTPATSKFYTRKA